MASNPQNQLTTAGMMRVAAILALVPFSKSTLWRKVKANEFPAPVKISKNITAWRVKDVNAWLESFSEGGQA